MYECEIGNMSVIGMCNKLLYLVRGTKCFLKFCVEIIRQKCNFITFF